MAFFHNIVKDAIKRDNIPVKDDEHYQELYTKYRDEYFLKEYGKTFLEWRESNNLSSKRSLPASGGNGSTH